MELGTPPPHNRKVTESTETETHTHSHTYTLLVAAQFRGGGCFTQAPTAIKPIISHITLSRIFKYLTVDSSNSSGDWNLPPKDDEVNTPVVLEGVEASKDGEYIQNQLPRHPLYVFTTTVINVAAW